MGKQILDKSTVSSMLSKAKVLSTEGSIVYPPQSPIGRIKTVTFGDLSIRSHAVILGDHPFCSAGCPLELAWDHNEETVVPIDEFETNRAPRQTRASMRTTWQERREILSEFSDRDIRFNNRKLQRSRRVKEGDLSGFFHRQE
jgi:hypothetical protein